MGRRKLGDSWSQQVLLVLLVLHHQSEADEGVGLEQLHFQVEGLRFLEIYLSKEIRIQFRVC